MEEDINENELEERMYAMLYYADDTQENVNEKDVTHIVENVPQSTVRRYWRTNVAQENHPYKKINTPKESPPDIKVSDIKPREESRDAPAPRSAVDLSVFLSSAPIDVKQTIEILENDPEKVVELDTSDEDEVIEVMLPPKPTITIESSDEENCDDNSVQAKSISLKQSQIEENQLKSNENKTRTKPDREISASPVPSVVSSVSDEFIRGDCIALKISSRHPDKHSFDFSLHGSDFIDPDTPTRKKKRKKNKDHASSTPIATELRINTSTTSNDEIFATPKSKAKNKKQRPKSYLVCEKSVPNADVYDSDSNQSVIDTNKNNYNDNFSVTKTSLASVDVYESDSSQSEIIKERNKSLQTKSSVNNDVDSFDSSVSLENRDSEHWITLDESETSNLTRNVQSVIDLTEDKDKEVECIDESIVIGNISGFVEVDDYEDKRSNEPRFQNEIADFVSTKIPAILYEDLDFDNLKGKDSICRRRLYSLTTLRAEMEKFYNESWGGENFNHQAILANMSSDAKLWAIDPKDKTPNVYRRHVCQYCNRTGHRDDSCRMKPPVCYMCGSVGHIETRCPKKICVNCGCPNYIYSAVCRNCSDWRTIVCSECGQKGHPSSHCPDLWRRYHNTIDENTPLEETHHTKNKQQLYCSGCTRRGHLVHTCRQFLPFSNLPINSPFVSTYSPVYYATNPDKSISNHANNQGNKPTQNFSQDVTRSSLSQPKHDRRKRQSKSPTVHETHCNKKRNISTSEANEHHQCTKSPNNIGHQKNNSQSKESVEYTNNTKNNTSESSKSLQTLINNVSDSNLNYSTNCDKKGQIIQDNEVSDTSNIVTSAKIYITKDVIENLKSKEGEEWLKETMDKHNIVVQKGDVNTFISITGKVGNQEAFQLDLREWTKNKSSKQKSDEKNNTSQDNTLKFVGTMPKNAHKTLCKLNSAFKSLNCDLGDPKYIYKQLIYLQNYHENLCKEKVVSPKKLANNKGNIKQVLKRLNMILLGQAGLADGPKHLDELYSLQKIIANTKCKTVAPDLRKAIEEHYNFIFTAIPRNDYEELISKYYTLKQTPTFTNKSNIVNPTKIIQKGNINPSSAPQKIQKNFIINNKGSGDIINFKSFKTREPLAEKTMNKLVFYHRRLLQARPVDAVLKKTRIELVRKLHSHITSLGSNANMSSKAMKKMRKIQGQAELFLTHNL